MAQSFKVDDVDTRMDYKEEQAQEIEILESIYPDELEKVSETEYTINLKLDVDSENQHYLRLKVSYPETYPEAAPDLDLEVGEAPVPSDGADSESDDDNDAYSDDDYDDDDDDEDKPRGPVIIADLVFFEQQDLEKLLHSLREEAEDNIGMPSVFALASSLKDQAEQYFQEKVDREQKKYDQELLAKEMEEQQKFIGTKVTVESFNKWRESFREEFGIEQKYHQRFIEIHQGKMTGKEIFEKGLAKVDDDEELAGDLQDKLSL